MGDVAENFIRPVSRQFPLPKGASENPEAWLTDYTEALERFSDDELRLAAKHVIQNRDSRTFPLVAECIATVRDAKNERNAEDLAKPADDRHDAWSDPRVKRADRLIQSPIGVQARKEGWLLSLWDFCREQERWPNRQEAEKIFSVFKKNVKETDEFFSAEAENGRPMIAAVKQYFAARAGRQRRLNALVDKFSESST